MRLLFLLLPLALFAQEKGYIDMHGGKKDQLTNKQSGFSNFSSLQNNTLHQQPIQKNKQPTKKKKEKRNYTKR